MPIHLTGEPGDYAPVVLLPGDPNRATRIAARFDGGLEASRLVSQHRGLLGYTGTVDGVPVSVQTTMMGTPTTTIVMEELLMLGVTTFIRVGTTGGFGKLGIGDAIVALSAASAVGDRRDARLRRADRPDRRLRGRPGARGGREGRGSRDARRAGGHERRVLRPAPGRRGPLGPAWLPLRGDGDGRRLPARDARAREGPARAGGVDPDGVRRDRGLGVRAGGPRDRRARPGSARPRTRSPAAWT